MKKMNYKFFGMALLALAFTACEEGELGASGETEAKLGQLYVDAESAASQLFKNADEALRKLDAGDPLPYTIDGATFNEDAGNPGNYILDYGTTGTNTRNKVIKGMIKFNASGTNYLTAGTTVGLTYDNYSEDDLAVTGGLNLTNSSANGGTSFTMDIQNLTIIDDSETENKELVLNGSKSLDWTAGSATTGDVSDDVYTISDLPGGGGTTAGYNPDPTTNTYQHSLNVAFTAPLVIDNSCSYRLTQGIIDLTLTSTDDPSPLTFTNATIDFLTSDGCDKFFSIKLVNTDNNSEISTTRQFTGF